MAASYKHLPPAFRYCGGTLHRHANTCCTPLIQYPHIAGGLGDVLSKTKELDSSTNTWGFNFAKLLIQSSAGAIKIKHQVERKKGKIKDKVLEFKSKAGIRLD